MRQILQKLRNRTSKELESNVSMDTKVGQRFDNRPVLRFLRHSNSSQKSKPSMLSKSLTSNPLTELTDFFDFGLNLRIRAKFSQKREKY